MQNLLNQEGTLALEEVYELARVSGVSIYGFCLPETHALSVMDANGRCSVGIDDSRRYSVAEEKCMLMHELGHCSTGAFYDSASPLSLVGKCEKKAEVWAIHRLLPLSSLKNAYSAGISTSFELAEHFELSESFVKKAIEYYIESGEIYGTLGKDDQ